MSLQKHQAEEILRKIKFLHYKFELVGGDEKILRNGYKETPFYNILGECSLQISIDTPDTRDRTTTLSLTHVIPCRLHEFTPETFVSFVFECVIRTVRHEIGELFTVNGLDPFNEHHPVSNMSILHAMFQSEKIAPFDFPSSIRFDIGGRSYRKNDFILPPFSDQA